MFMEPEITKSRKWVEIETAMGTWYVEPEYIPGEVLKEIRGKGDLSKEARDELADYTEVFSAEDIYDARIITGIGARMSAPGYLDCTDWSVFETVEEAREWLEECD